MWGYGEGVGCSEDVVSGVVSQWRVWDVVRMWCVGWRQGSVVRAVVTSVVVSLVGLYLVPLVCILQLIRGVQFMHTV